MQEPGRNERPVPRNGFMKHGDPLFMHGRGYQGPREAPVCTWRCEKPPRDDHDHPVWLSASEFSDTPTCLHAKITELASLLRASKRTVLYTGAGISAAVVGQAARSGTNVVGWKGCPSEAKPTFTHHALALLGRAGFVHSWAQQNHDGLPQKAGFPQHLINEVHGSWFDPSNPVVKYSGNLKGDAFAWMENDASNADLVLVLGTSLGGLNADQVATNAADRSLVTLRVRGGGQQQCLGSVCINLQQTPQDGKMTLRLFGKSDAVLALLLAELGLSFDGLGGGCGPRAAEAAAKTTHWPRESRVLVPYDRNGKRLASFNQPPSATPEDGDVPGNGAAAGGGGEEEDWMWLDLSDGAEVQLEAGHNCAGAGQPAHKHITSGVGRVSARDDRATCILVEVQGARMKLGLWWLEAARLGTVAQLPLVNRRPDFGRPPRGQRAAATKEAAVGGGKKKSRCPPAASNENGSASKKETGASAVNKR